jgi:CheY-like chemotaxis protein
MTAAEPLILVVDDDYDFLEYNRAILKGAGYRVLTAIGPRQALAEMAKERPDLVISDLMMTDLNSGFSFARALKEDVHYGDIPIIICTSISATRGLDFDPRSQTDLDQMHIDAYMRKPPDVHRLLAMIDDLLGGVRPPFPSHGD